MLIHDHDPLHETNTLLRSRRGWAEISGHSLTRVRTRLSESAKKRMNSDLGENLEGLHQDCQRSAPQSAQKYVLEKKATLLHSVQEENLEGQNSALLQPRIGYDRRHFHQLFHQLRVTQNRTHRDVLRKDLGHFDGSGSVVSVPKNWSTSGSCSTVCGTGASRICTMGAQQTKSTMCSVVCRWTRSCGRGSARIPGRNPAVSSSNNSKNTASPAALDLCLRGALCAASPSLSVVCARGPSYFAPAATLSKLWWAAADRAIATLCCSCRHHERRRRCLRQAEPWSPCNDMSTTWVLTKGKRASREVTLESDAWLLWLLWLWLFQPLDVVCVCPHHVSTCKASRKKKKKSANLKAWVRALHGI